MATTLNSLAAKATYTVTIWGRVTGEVVTTWRDLSAGDLLAAIDGMTIDGIQVVRLVVRDHDGAVMHRSLV